ncbi:MAG: (2Fe-2S)-binding protein [Deltaproteobacteria bacterium]|nr:(2Fe-2S)-binding protein [Deltaproteobacteria bacterium]
MLRLNINGTPYEVETKPLETLLAVLRDYLNLTGTKDGCGEGVCGACTVLVDGRPVSSCLLLASYAEGKNITTIEGVATDGGLHALQKAFLDNGAFQCGYCTPGMILMAKALIEQNPNPSTGEIRDFMAGNICRCTSYVEIVRAVKQAGRKMRRRAKGS